MPVTRLRTVRQAAERELAGTDRGRQQEKQRGQVVLLAWLTQLSEHGFVNSLRLGSYFTHRVLCELHQIRARWGQTLIFEKTLSSRYYP
jgi:hypothetical protein